MKENESTIEMAIIKQKTKTYKQINNAMYIQPKEVSSPADLPIITHLCFYTSLEVQQRTCLFFTKRFNHTTVVFFSGNNTIKTHQQTLYRYTNYINWEN